LVMGTPAKVIRPLTDKEKESLRLSALKYAENAVYHLKHRINVAPTRRLAK